jgi:hypothetical protein
MSPLFLWDIWRSFGTHQPVDSAEKGTLTGKRDIKPEKRDIKPEKGTFEVCKLLNLKVNSPL